MSSEFPEGSYNASEQKNGEHAEDDRIDECDGYLHAKLTPIYDFGELVICPEDKQDPKPLHPIESRQAICEVEQEFQLSAHDFHS